MSDKLEPVAYTDEVELKAVKDGNGLMWPSPLPNPDDDIPLYTADQVKELEGKLEKAEEARDRFQAMCRENYEAFTAMRNDINEVIGDMASQESTLRNGPEMTHECAAVVSAVKGYATTTEAALAEASKAFNHIDALDPEEGVYGCSADALRGLVIRMGETARAWLQANKGVA